MSTYDAVVVSELARGSHFEVQTREGNCSIQSWTFQALGGNTVQPLSLNGKEIIGPPVEVIGSQFIGTRGRKVPRDQNGQITVGMHLILHGEDPIERTTDYARLGETVAVKIKRRPATT